MSGDKQLDEAICVICLDSRSPWQLVRVQGLVKTPHYNERLGQVEGTVDGAERLKVVLKGRDRKVLSLKPENIVTIDDGAPIQSGCACRGDAGLAHVACRVKAAERQAPEQGSLLWQKCQTCKEAFTGTMQLGLAQAFFHKVWWGEGEANEEWQDALLTMANALGAQGRYWEAEQLCREVLPVQQWGFGAEDPATLITASNLAIYLAQQGKDAEAERIQREVLAAQQRQIGEENPDTLVTAMDLATTLSNQERHAEAGKLQREVLEIQQRKLGTEHPNTLMTAGNLANSLSNQGRHVDAERMQREVLAARQRKLGADHPDTLLAACNLAGSLSDQGKHEEAERIEREVLAAQQSRLGADHPYTLLTARNLARSLSNQGKYAEAEKVQQAPSGPGSVAAKATAAWGALVGWGWCCAEADCRRLPRPAPPRLSHLWQHAQT